MNTYYVYGNFDVDHSCVYIGMGQKSRAWDTHSGHAKTTPYGKERLAWFKEQQELGRIPCDWVQILHRGLSKEEAREIEKQEIAIRKPKLNKSHNPDKPHHLRKVTDAEIMLAMEWRYQGETWETINSRLGYKRGTLAQAIKKGRKGKL